MQNLISFLNTENEFFCNILTFPFAFLEMSLLVYFSKILFNLKISNRVFFLSTSCLTLFCAFFRLFLPLPFNFMLNLFVYIVFIKLFLNISLFKATFSSSVFIALTALLEYIINLFVTKIYNFNILASAIIPLYKIAFCSSLLLLILLIFLIFKHFLKDFLLADDFNFNDKFNILIILLLLVIIICPNLLFLIIINMKIPTLYIIYNIVCSFLFFFLGTYNAYKLNKLQITKRELETANLYNSTLSKLVDSNRAFRHDIANIVNSIGGFIELNDMDGLKNYYNTGLLPEIKKSNNLSLLNPDVINSPPLFGLLLAKYNYADSLNVKVELNSFFDYSTINMNIFDFVKIFGILLDNAIEAASKCHNKFVSIHITIDFYNRKQVFKISNTFLDNNIDIDKIFEKDFSTKKIKSGFGLWEVKQLLKKYSNVKLLPSKNDIYFTQKLEIYF